MGVAVGGCAGVRTTLSAGEPGTGAAPEHHRDPKPPMLRVLRGKGQWLEEHLKVCTSSQHPWHLRLQSPLGCRGKGLGSTVPRDVGTPRPAARSGEDGTPISASQQSSQPHQFTQKLESLQAVVSVQPLVAQPR